MSNDNTPVFGDFYAQAYDSIYQDKDYHSEVSLLETIFQRYNRGQVQSILDLGCGTGNHALPLARQGYQVTGVDISAGMLAKATSKAKIAGLQVEWVQADLRSLELNKKFDAVLLMFAVLGYQIENQDILGALHSASIHLNPGSLLIFDVWYGPAVLAQRPSDRFKQIQIGDRQILRFASGNVDMRRQVCRVHYRLWELEGQSLINNTEEDHDMRFFFPQELELFLHQSGFSLIKLSAFPEIDRDPDEDSWNVLAIAQYEGLNS